MCRDFSDSNIECGISLVRLYLGYSQLNKAQDALESMLVLERQKRAMLNYIYPYDCDLPTVAIEVYAAVLVANENSMDILQRTNIAKYLLLLVSFSCLIMYHLYLVTLWILVAPSC
jgi:uncharacterized membrane protein (GlpM family)